MAPGLVEQVRGVGNVDEDLPREEGEQAHQMEPVRRVPVLIRCKIRRKVAHASSTHTPVLESLVVLGCKLVLSQSTLQRTISIMKGAAERNGFKVPSRDPLTDIHEKARLNLEISRVTTQPLQMHFPHRCFAPRSGPPFGR